MRSLRSFVLVTLLAVALAAPAPARTSEQTDGNLVVAGVVAVSAAVAVVITVLVIHNRHKYEKVNGCVIAGGGTVQGKIAGSTTAMSLKDEKDLRIYTLTGNLAKVRVGDQMTLAGKSNTEAGTFAFDVKKVTADSGHCVE